MTVYPWDWKQHREGDRNVIELEGKTKRLVCDLHIGEEVIVPLIPAFQGATMRVRITVELIPEKGTT